MIDHLVQRGLPCQYFFIRFEDKKKQKLSLILRSLAYQLAQSNPAYADNIRLLENTTSDIRASDYRNIWQWLFKQSLFHLNINYPIYWVIDGIDEAENPDSVVKILLDLRLTNIPIRVLAVSRQTYELSSSFAKLGKQIHIEAIRTEGDQEDFLRYINQELDVAGDDSYKQEIITSILERSRGNFLWVNLAVQRINRCHTKLDVENVLMDLPPGMEALYDRMAETIQAQPSNNDRKLAVNILSWSTLR